MRTASPETPRYAGSAGRAPPLPFATPATLLKLPSTMLRQPYIALNAVVAKAPWRTQAEGSSGDCGRFGADTPSTRATADSERGYGVFEERFPLSKDTAEDAPSKGSIGHPHCCASACKYTKKARGCKDGADCDRCHLCTFQVVKPRRQMNENFSQNASTVDAPPGVFNLRHARPRRRTQINEPQAGATFCIS